VIEVSTNLQQWAPLAVLTNTTGQADFADTIPPTASCDPIARGSLTDAQVHEEAQIENLRCNGVAA